MRLHFNTAISKSILNLIYQVTDLNKVQTISTYVQQFFGASFLTDYIKFLMQASPEQVVLTLQILDIYFKFLKQSSHQISIECNQLCALLYNLAIELSGSKNREIQLETLQLLDSIKDLQQQ